jgi:hypothetical protein
MEQLKRLCHLALRIERYNTELVKNQARADLKCEADAFGYSYQHWQETGRWQKYTELETELKPVSKPIQKLETKRIETVKKPNTRNEGVL